MDRKPRPQDEAIVEEDHDHALQTESPHVVDHAAERRLCFKFDTRILPVLTLLYLFNALDKGNIANAQTKGLSKDLNFLPGQYNIVLSIFFVPFVLFAPPIALLSKRFGPALALPTMTLVFGSVTILTVTARSFGGILALRWILGMSEAAFFPVLVYYLTTFYRRAELARRLAVLYAASNLANGFSGLLAFAIFRLPDKGLLLLYPWRYLFLIEGAASVLLAIVAFFLLPRKVVEARFLNEEERALASRRIRLDSSADDDETRRRRPLSDALRVFLAHPSALAFLAIEICLGMPLQAVALFLPQIIQRLGYPTVQTNLLTVAPNASGAVVLLVLAFASDASRLRFPFIVLAFALTLTGFVVYAAIDDVEASLRLAYAATFIMCWGTSTPSVLLSTWYNNNIADEGRRLALTSVGVPLANLMGLVASHIFKERDAPKYTPALVTVACFGASGGLITAGLGLYMMIDNRRRNKRAGVCLRARDVPTQWLREGPSVEEFRWFL
ncbi:hypothetical protein L249_2539 [Ophiocordyceps polyrhachis-furcata BCC 54312]|uniref:Major facilitator superfamily (MFS) profile domain-containing protein n=1 Tax=Ophiocordyceps polyrhachis-furcata BCC 54312 TaxID=1330021 RepID=A0A367LQV6_9HYPO|nr:hypothetical protein L249_2539 [Ophiocordyceps polyrhachis-furcata BCC 54312]